MLKTIFRYTWGKKISVEQKKSDPASYQHISIWFTLSLSLGLKVLYLSSLSSTDTQLLRQDALSPKSRHFPLAVPNAWNALILHLWLKIPSFLQVQVKKTFSRRRFLNLSFSVNFPFLITSIILYIACLYIIVSMLSTLIDCELLESRDCLGKSFLVQAHSQVPWPVGAFHKYLLTYWPTCLLLSYKKSQWIHWG